MAGLVALAILLALLLGLGAATGQRLVLIGLFGLVAGLAVLAAPVALTFWTMIVMSIVVVGPVTFFLRVSQLQWLPPLLGAVLFVQALVVLVNQRTAVRHVATGAPAFMYLLVLYWLVITFSGLVAGVSAVEALMGARYNVFVWGALMIFVVGAIGPTTIDRVWKTLLLFAAFQPPMALYQYVFVASKRATGELKVGAGSPPWDVVIGTFPGNDQAGGNSAGMGIFLVSMMLLAIALWREKLLSGKLALGVALCAVGSIALAEVKAVVLLIPVALGLLYRRELVRRPGLVLGVLVGSVLLAGVLLWGYQKLHYDSRAKAGDAEVGSTTVIGSLKRQFSPQEYNRLDTGLQWGRLAGPQQWWEEQGKTSDVFRTLFGHGIGKTQESNLGVGALVRKYGTFMVDRSSLLILLWETGVLGLFLYSGMLGTGAILSARLAREGSVPRLHRVYLGVGGVVLVLMLITLPYKNFAVRLTAVQLLIILILGQAHFWWRHTRNRRSGEGSSAPGSLQ